MILTTVFCGTGQAGDEFFENRVRPLLAEKCYGCHTESHMGGLRLDSKEAFQKGGKSGPVAVAGDPEHSLIIKALRYNDTRLKMPPTGRLKDEEIAAIESWIKSGAQWPAGMPTAAKTKAYVISDKQRAFWSFQRIKEPTPPAVRQSKWASTSIDRFVLAKLESEHLDPVPMADKRTLIRRATLDLTGLPPTHAEVAAFENDKSPQAFAKVVDRLLASPAYGERAARLWLDIARYSDDRLDSERDNFYENSFRYRDWVVQAMREDMPYNTFVKAQIAGDLLPDHEKYEAGLGYYALSPEMQDDRVDATSRGFLGLTVACAQCHDHKYDPIPTADYYSMLGIFRNTERSEIPLAPTSVVASYKAQKERIAKKEAEIKRYVDDQSEQLGEILATHTTEYLLAAAFKPLPADPPAKDTTKPEATREPEPAEPVALNEPSSLDAETLIRWQKYLSKPEKDQPFFKEWFQAVARHASAQELEPIANRIQTEVQRVFAEKKRIDDENHIRLGVNPSRDDLSKADLVSLQRNDFVLWNEMFGGKGVFHYGNPGIGRFFFGPWKEHLDTLQAQLKVLKKDLPPQYPFLHVVSEVKTPVEQRVWIRGSESNPGEPAPAHFLSILSPGTPEPFERAKARLQLAEAIVSPSNPLTARVIVNRVWQQHLGQGLVRTPSNFGTQGDPPSHPELLDYLAARFMQEGWSLKKLHREIMLSSVYQLSAENTAAGVARDPDNRWLWRYNRRRLDAESLRDSILSVSGELDRTEGGPAKAMAADNHRRTMYTTISRRRLEPMLALFDFPNPNNTSEQRMETTVPLQKLFFMNSEFILAEAKALAEKLQKAATEDAKIRLAYQLVLQRDPAQEEKRAASEFLKMSKDNWPLYTQVLLSSNEFIYLH